MMVENGGWEGVPRRGNEEIFMLEHFEDGRCFSSGDNVI